MNFKLNECQHNNCFKTKVQLNKCEIHMDVTFTFHSPEGATGYQASLGAPDTSVEFQRVNSRIGVAMMVFAPIYVAQMISSYLRYSPCNGSVNW